MNRKNMLAIATLLIAVMAVASMAYALKGGVKPLKGVYVSGGDNKMYVLDPDTLAVVASKAVGQSSTWPSNQYAGDKYIWLPGGTAAGKTGLTVINSKDLSVACATGYGVNWVEVTPDVSKAYLTVRSTDTILEVSADVASGCPDTASPNQIKVYDTSLHDAPCDMTITPDANWLCVPDIDSGKNLGNGKDSITMFNANDLSDYVILRMPRCNNAKPITSFMTTIDPLGNKDLCLVENFEALVAANSGSESVIDISDPRNPVELVRFVQDSVMSNLAGKCPNAYTDSGKVYLDFVGGGGRLELKGGFGKKPRSDEFTRVQPGGNKYNFVMMKDTKEVVVIDVNSLEITNHIALPSTCKTDTGDFSRDGKSFFVNCDTGNQVCKIDVGTQSLVGCVNLGVKTMGITVK